VLPLMVTTVIATVLGRRLIGGTVYELKLIRRGVNWDAVKRPRALARRNVASLERREAFSADPDEPISQVAQRIGSQNEWTIPIVKDKHVVGIVTLADLIEHVRTEPLRPIGTIAHPTPTLNPNDSFERAATLLADHDVHALPVVKPDTQEFIGLVTRRDVLEAYRGVVRL